jgi:hypothetical protein
VKVESYERIYLIATLPSQIGKYKLQIILTDFSRMSASETIMLEVINEPPIFGFGGPKSQKIKMN